ncbi:hypothetical protein N177_1288 [Lutibaculum baratangense AMV1]|uniref:histidine kinase n=1 Tax=Lutibaculum baratangense AMV1 TaxID=631454 RepID=V4TJ53_9HYPH|nr:hypothetical protein N177_1288 [Lutibaculum baratangense AMV1]
MVAAATGALLTCLLLATSWAAATAVAGGALLGALATQQRRLRRSEARCAQLHAREAVLVGRNSALAGALALQRAASTDTAAYSCDATGRLVEANATFFETFGLGADAIGHRFFPERVPASDQASSQEDGDQCLRTATGPRWFAVEERVRLDAAGREAGRRIVLRDADERHRRETELARRLSQARSAEEAQSRLVAAVTHEVRTPVGGILGLTNLLLETELTPSQQSYVQSVRSSAGALLGLIDDLLDHASLKAGRLAVVERRYDLPSLVQEVCELLGPRAEEKGLSLGVFLPRNMPAALLGDPARVRQVLINLVGNAIKFTDHGGVLVCVRPLKDKFELCVRDTGRGIAPADQDRIFGEFERAGEAGSLAGSGLGLAISRKLVEMMGGSLALISRRGHGSAFTMTLPLRAADGVPDRQPPSLAGRRFIVACGSSVLRKSIALSLRDEGAAVAAFARPRRVGQAIAAGTGADGILLDLAMFRRLRPELGDAHAVVALSPAQREALPEILQRPATSYLITPIRRGSLLAQLSPRSVSPAVEPDGKDGRRALLADDDAVAALVVGSMLRKRGMIVERVGSGQEAVARAGRSPSLDLVLLDINMPGLGGIAAAAAIRNREARLCRRRTPIVALSAGATETQLASAVAAGIDAFLEKPVSPQDLSRCLEALEPEWTMDGGGSDPRLETLSQMVR